MTKKHFLTIVIFCLIVVAVWQVFKNTVNKKGSLVGQTFMQQVINQQPTPTLTHTTMPTTPKTFQFDSLTDLESELEKVNPQVLDSDFE